jgi:putative endonuclease
MERHYYTYIMASLSRRVYVGVTNNLIRRTLEHKQARVLGFAEKYRINRLVYVESFQYVRYAIAREKEIKGWRRSRKVALIEEGKPDMGGRNSTGWWAVRLAESWAAGMRRESRSLA